MSPPTSANKSVRGNSVAASYRFLGYPTLFVLAGAVEVFALAAWFLTGSHFGWSMSQVPVMQVDPVTEIAFPSWEKRWVLGIDFLLVSFAASSALFLAGIYRLRSQKTQVD